MKSQKTEKIERVVDILIKNRLFPGVASISNEMSDWTHMRAKQIAEEIITELKLLQNQHSRR